MSHRDLGTRETSPLEDIRMCTSPSNRKDQVIQHLLGNLTGSIMSAGFGVLSLSRQVWSNREFERQVRPRRPFAQTALELEMWLLYEEQQRFWSSMINLTYVLSSCD